MARLRARDVRNLHRLLGEVRALGNDPLSWPAHALNGLLELLNARAALSAIMTLPTLEVQPALELLYVVGFESEELAESHYRLQLEPDVLKADPYSYYRFAQPLPRFSSRTRQEVVSDEEFYSHPEVADKYLSYDADQILDAIFVALSIGKIVGLMVVRRVGAPPFGQRDKQLIKRFYIEMARMWQTELAVPDELQIRGLAPQQKQVLWMLASGDSEKQIASKLNISPHTVHDYVKELYKHFDVNSRAELLVKVLRLPQRDQQDIS